VIRRETVSERRLIPAVDALSDAVAAFFGRQTDAAEGWPLYSTRTYPTGAQAQSDSGGVQDDHIDMVDDSDHIDIM
jgi:hypothetical protein